jgi:hypothetical protein
MVTFLSIGVSGSVAAVASGLIMGST